MKNKKLMIISILFIMVLLAGSFFIPKRIIKKDVPNVSVMNMYMVKEFINTYTPEKILGHKVYLEKYETAIDFAESMEKVLFDVYGEEEIIMQRPYSIMIDKKNQLWYLEGDDSYLTKDLILGGVVYAVASKETEEVLMIVHTK